MGSTGTLYWEGAVTATGPNGAKGRGYLELTGYSERLRFLSAAALPQAASENVRTEVGDIPAIEGLRGVAVLWVMVFHYFVLRDGKSSTPSSQW